MTRIGHILIALSTAAFVLSSLFMALSGPRAGTSQPQPLISYPLPQMAEQRDLLSRLLQPDTPVIWALVACIWGGLVFHAIRVFRRHKPGDHSAGDILPLALALLTAAIWPWTLRNHPVIGFFIALVMLVSAVVAALQGWRERGRLRGSIVIAGFAGWATVLFYASFAALLSHQLGFAATPAAVTTIALCSMTGIAVQVTLGSPASYAAVLIWGFAGIAAATMAVQPAIAMAAAIGIAALAVVLVRAAS